MKTLKEFLNTIQTQLNEAVPEHLRHIPDSWDHHGAISSETKQKITNALGPKGFKMFPLDNVDDIDPDVAEHLTKHSWQVTDYAKGMASKKTMTSGNAAKGILPQEKIVHKKIGSILDETAAPDHVKKAFTNDPARASSGGSGMSVLVSTTPHGLAAGTVGTHFDNQTCMNLASGSNRHYLPIDSKHATHSVMLVASNDKGAVERGEPDKVIARRFWKQHSSEHHGDIFRPENRGFGSDNTAFTNTGARLASELYPAKAGVEYTKHPDLYDDSSTPTYTTKSRDNIEHSVNTGKDIVDQYDSSLDKEMIDHAITHYNKNKDTLSDSAKKNFISNMAKIGNLNSQHVAALHKLGKESNDEDGISELIEQHGDKLSSNTVKDIVSKTKINDIPFKVLLNTKLPQEVVDKFEPHQYVYLRRSLLKPHHYQKLVDNFVNNQDTTTAKNLSNNSGHYTKEHLDTISKIKHRDVANIVMNEPKFDKSHHDTLINNHKTNYFSKNGIKPILENSKFATLDDVKNNGGKLNDLLKNKNLSTAQYKNIANAIVNDKDLINSEDYLYIPEHISDHFTNKDYEKLAKSKLKFDFEAARHSNKHIEAIHKNIKDDDKTISEHKNNEEEKNSNYDPENDKVHNTIRNVLQQHIAKYARAIDSHLYMHGDNNQDEVDKAEKHVRKIDDIKNYDRYDRDKDLSHYYDNVSGVNDKIDELRENN